MSVVVELLLASLLVQESAAAPAAKAPRSLLVITLDTTRRDYLGFMGRKPSPSPMLDHLASFSVVFNDALTAVPLTLPSHTSLFTGLYPVNHGVRDNSTYRVPVAAHTLAEILREHGYATRAAVSAVVLDPAFGLDQGFDRYRAPPRTVERADAPVAEDKILPATVMVDRAIEDLHELAPTPQPFFYWLHLYDAHFPYTPPVMPKFTPEQAADPILTNKLLYEAEIRCMDRELGRLFGELQQLGLLENLVIVVCADHGESLSDAPEKAHGYFLYDPTVRVPLFVRDPDFKAGGVDVPVSLIDVTPTLLALLGIDASGERFDGLDLSPWMRDATRPAPDRALMLETLFAWTYFHWAPSFGCTRGSFKYIHSHGEELYDRAADPGERNNLFAPNDPHAAALSRQVAAHLSSASPLATTTVALTESDRARLQALGYAASSNLADLPTEWSALPDPLQKIQWTEKFDEVTVAAGRHELGRAIELLRGLIAEEPNCATMIEQLGIMLQNQGTDHVAEAAAQFDAALKLDAHRVRSWYGRAQCAAFEAERERTAAKALREQGKQAEAAAHAKSERAASELAESALRMSLECEPDYPEALTLLSRLLGERGDRLLKRGEKSQALELYGEVAHLLDRFLAVVPQTAPEWTNASTVRTKLKERITELRRGS